MCHAILGLFPWNVWMAAWEETNLGVDARRDVMVPKGTKIAEMQIVVALVRLRVWEGARVVGDG